MTAQTLSKRIRNAVKTNDTDTFIHLIESDRSQLNSMTPFGTWLHVAASFGSLEIARYLISIGADVNSKGGDFRRKPSEPSCL